MDLHLQLKYLSLLLKYIIKSEIDGKYPAILKYRDSHMVETPFGGISWERSSLGTEKNFFPPVPFTYFYSREKCVWLNIFALLGWGIFS